MKDTPKEDKPLSIDKGQYKNTFTSKIKGWVPSEIPLYTHCITLSLDLTLGKVISPSDQEVMKESLTAWDVLPVVSVTSLYGD